MFAPTRLCLIALLACDSHMRYMLATHVLLYASAYLRQH